MESTDSLQMMSNSNNVYQKGCECRVMKCLNRKCGCFAAGLHCAEICKCLNNCFNIPNRELIRNRPEVSPNIHDYSVEGIDRLTQYRLGCQCRSIKCNQGRCMCYRTKVGCNKRCVCKGCKNVYGIRGEENNNTASGSITVSAIDVPESECSQSLTPSMTFGNSIHENKASTSGGNGNCEIITLDQQSYPKFDFPSPNNRDIDIDVYGKRGEDKKSTESGCMSTVAINETGKNEVDTPEFEYDPTPFISFGHLGHENIASTSGGYGNGDMIPWDQQSYPNVNQFTASIDTRCVNLDVDLDDSFDVDLDDLDFMNLDELFFDDGLDK